MSATKTGKRPQRKSARSPRRGTRRPSRGRQDAIAMLRQDHELVQGLFDRFEKARGGGRKEGLVSQICDELEVHAQLEEEIFYPAVREAIGDDDLMDEATVEHQSAKDLIAQLRTMSTEDELYDAKVTVLGEYIKHHVREEQGEMFPKARRSGVDLMDLGERMRARKEELTSGTIETLKRLLS